MNNKTIYLPGLNGLRGIAALTVLIAHIIDSEINLLGIPSFFIFRMPQFFVTTFFVISGFIITYLLLNEKAISSIDVKNFYIRRILRICPLYYLYIIICLFLPFYDSSFSRILSPTICWYLLFTAYVPFSLGFAVMPLGHFWTIGVEEQFYAFWPLVMKIKNSSLVSTTVIIILVVFSLKTGSYFFFGKKSQIYLILSVLRFHNTVLGALGAILYYQRNHIFIKISSSKLAQGTSWAVFFLIGFGLIRLPSIIAHEFASIISLIIIMGQITVKNRLVNLENNICSFLGQISYGIYVLHPLCITLLIPMLNPLSMGVFAKSMFGAAIVFMITISLAYLSYQYYEKFFIKLKDRFTTIKTPISNVTAVEKEYALQ
ncbi:hypothetical protein GCM10028805_61170 [Spirosoma harenae]